MSVNLNNNKNINFPNAADEPAWSRPVSFGGPLERNRAEVLAIASIAQREKDWEEQLLDLWLGYEDQRRWRALVSAEKIDRGV